MQNASEVLFSKEGGKSGQYGGNQGDMFVFEPERRFFARAASKEVSLFMLINNVVLWARSIHSA